MVNQFVPCAGFVVFSTDLKKVVMVRTPRGNLSFPKGKRKKGETDSMTAYRELEEETGLTKDDIVMLTEEFIDEVSNNGHPNVRYFICSVKDDKFRFVIEDADELEAVGWYEVSKAGYLPNLKTQRKEVLGKAVEMVGN